MLEYNRAEVTEEINFQICKSKDAGIKGNRNVDIVSKEWVDNAPMNIFHKLFCKIDLGSHKIRYFS